jgi:Carboxypeptidase regulatory-like domain
MRQWSMKIVQVICAVFAFVAAITAIAQTPSVISGTVRDTLGAVIPHAKLTLTNTLTNTVSTTETNADGIYSFPTLVSGHYKIEVEAPGFSSFVQNGIILELDQAARIDIALKVGSVQSEVTVNANASPLEFDSPTLEYDISPTVEAALPLLVSGGPSIASTFVAVMPGVSSPNGISSYFSLRINGGEQEGQEGLVDGISMQEGALSQGGIIGFGDFPMSPDMIDEVKVLTSNYGPQFGGTASGVIEMTTKSGTAEFHGSVYENLRNTDLNAKAFGSTSRSPDDENQFGGFVGGPVKIPKLYSARNKMYFFFDNRQYKSTGGVNPSTLSIPTLLNRQGNFTDQLDAEGHLLPIYDPATTKIDAAGNVTRQQFMGCNGDQPNVICSTRLSPIALGYFSHLPTPTNDQPTNNYRVPYVVPNSLQDNTEEWFGKVDEYLRDNDHIFGSVWHSGAPVLIKSELPLPISFDELNGNPESEWVVRANWDHTFSKTILNHFAFGYLNFYQGGASMNYNYADVLPMIGGVEDNTSAPPQINLDGYTQYGNTTGSPVGRITTRPAYIENDLLTIVKGRHTISLGGEFRYLETDATENSLEAGLFDFDGAQTGLLGVPGGNALASFLLGAVNSASAEFYTEKTNRGRQHAASAFAGDVWKLLPNLTVSYGLRWEFWSPGTDADGNTSWLDLNKPNPDAGGLPGSLVFATPRAGAAYSGTQAPENPFYKGFAPRLGLIYSPDKNTTITASYGITYDQLFYTGYGGGGLAKAGFNNDAQYSSTQDSGLAPSFYLSQGFPGDTRPLPDFSLGAVNGYDSFTNDPWRDASGGRLPYSQEWDLSVAHAVAKDAMVSITYVGAKGTHLPSRMEPKNVLPLNLLSMGNELNADFQPGQTELDGVQAPYAGWSQQMQNCSPSVAQALLPYPQFCQELQNLTEHNGYSIYHALQLVAQKRYSSGLYLHANYTFSKLIGTSVSEFDGLNQSAYYSPYQIRRYYTVSPTNTPQSFNFLAVYDLPFGKGRLFANRSGLLEQFVGGWQISGITSVISGTPLGLFSGGCNVPSAFLSYNCYPDIVPGQTIKQGSQAAINHAIVTNSNYSAYNKNAFVGGNFATPYQFPSFTIPTGPTYVGGLGFAYINSDVSTNKSFALPHNIKLKVGASFFNVFNEHSLGSNFSTGLQSSTFGQWTGGTSNPRNGQANAYLTF